MMVTDFHSHILPGIDDGSADLAESLTLLEMEAAQGVSCVVATPHFYPRHDSPRKFLERRQAAWEALRARMTPGMPEIRLGAEVYYFPHMSDSDALRDLAIQGTDCILIELPTSRWPDSVYRELEQIPANLGLRPIVAHVDRYLSPLATHGIPKRLAELPVLVQANASFFQRRSTGAMALRMLRQDQIHLLGSDCHNLTTRVPNLAGAVEVITRRLGTEALARIRDYEQSVL